MGLQDFLFLGLIVRNIGAIAVHGVHGCKQFLPLFLCNLNSQVQLTAQLEFRNLKEQSEAIIKDVRGGDRQRIMADHGWMQNGVFLRPITGRVAVVPALCKMKRSLVRIVAVNRLAKSNRNSVSVDMETAGHLDILARVAKSLKTTRIGRIRSPTVHAR